MGAAQIKFVGQYYSCTIPFSQSKNLLRLPLMTPILLMSWFRSAQTKCTYWLLCNNCICVKEFGYQLCERVINKAKHTTKLQKTGYLLLHSLLTGTAVVSSQSAEHDSFSHASLVSGIPGGSPGPGVPKGRVVPLPFGLRWMSFKRREHPFILFYLY